jgi:predicted O-methyltransferase YrrM
MHPTEVEALYEVAVQVPTGGLVVEVGSQLGRSSSVLAQLAKAIGFHNIHIDPYTEQPEFLVGWARMMHGIGSQFTLMCMQTQAAEWYLSQLGQVDMAFIDGDHERPAVEIDMRIVASKIRPGGYLVAHDYTCNSHHGVAEAIDPFIASGMWDFIKTVSTMGIWRRNEVGIESGEWSKKIHIQH